MRAGAIQHTLSFGEGKRHHELAPLRAENVFGPVGPRLQSQQVTNVPVLVATNVKWAMVVALAAGINC